MCVYNEKDTVLAVVRRVQAVPIEKEIVIVDNASWVILRNRFLDP